MPVAVNGALGASSSDVDLQYCRRVLPDGSHVSRYDGSVTQYGHGVLRYGGRVLRHGSTVLQYGSPVSRSGSHVLQYLALAGHLDRGLKVRPMVLPDVFIDHDKPEKMYERAGLHAAGIVATVLGALGRQVQANEI